MSASIELVLVFVALTNLMLLGSSRLATCVRLSASQGMALAALPLLVGEGEIGARVWVFAIGTFTLKGIVFPRLLLRAIRSADVRREVEPMLGYATSVLLGTLLLAISFWLAARITPPRPSASPLVVPLALATILNGLLLIVSRRKALMQVVGYLVLENGIFIFGVALVREQPLMVEMGILLDVFVAVFVMGIMIFHISREFDHIDVDQLASLKD